MLLGKDCSPRRRSEHLCKLSAFLHKISTLLRVELIGGGRHWTETFVNSNGRSLSDEMGDRIRGSSAGPIVQKRIRGCGAPKIRFWGGR